MSDTEGYEPYDKPASVQWHVLKCELREGANNLLSQTIHAAVWSFVPVLRGGEHNLIVVEDVGGVPVGGPLRHDQQAQVPADRFTGVPQS